MRARQYHTETEFGMKISSINPALLLCLIILLILLIFFSLSLSVSKQHNPFLSTYEFIVVKKSSRVAVFFVFNVIVITICRGSLSFKPSDGDFEYSLSFPPVVYEFDDDTKAEAKDEDYDDSAVDDSDEYHGDDGYEEDDDDDGEGSDDDVDSDDEQVEDLETRIEDFIAKSHRQWREELIYERILCIAATEFQ
ncbi:uncharacterized protein LOC136068171 [Quercus suber]|uniref:uncharacterized protein LOC136068171 n=1 Tax=Quercus suber TaxID=58331 RepID=UPI000D29CD49|nr:hypothetical protein CFP56_34357 [Quercus suber]